MTEQLFRFSVLRAPEPARGLSPIVVDGAREPLDDQLVETAIGAVAWLKSGQNTPASTVADFVVGLDVDPADWDASALAGLIGIAKRQFVVVLRGAAATATVAARRELAGAGEFLTAAVLMSELAALDDGVPLQEWIQAHPIQIDFAALFPAAWRPKNALSREPAVCDHFVVRETLARRQRLGERKYRSVPRRHRRMGRSDIRNHRRTDDG